jgi:broad specificity phosphatase PhoE
MNSREYAIQIQKSFSINTNRMLRSKLRVSSCPSIRVGAPADNVAQNEIIETMTKLNEKQSTRIAALEKSLAAAQKAAEAAASAPASSAKPEPAPVASTSTLGKSDLKELKALREEVTGLRKGVKEKDQKSKLAVTELIAVEKKLTYSHAVGERV